MQCGIDDTRISPPLLVASVEEQRKVICGVAHGTFKMIVCRHESHSCSPSIFIVVYYSLL